MEGKRDTDIVIERPRDGETKRQRGKETLTK